ncbi:HD-like signal output (HDOD) domain, no enzymatic activity [Aquipseudomonas alcaligenes]|uniref:response regulator n=1 Tax=Aquipseudomonas alcaligenes TaxID=43263 RepID=UPI0009550FF3|nr:response regulator [Pseudomonas alcaligenes]SIR97319.1 HD-like signal output (HDOD) domain, no enzymatic activity [Pseudomonas alcaligenes]
MRVMIVDDDPWLADLLKQLVQSVRPAAEIDCHGQLQGAIAAYNQHTYDLILADWNLPDGSGVDLLRHVRRTSASLPLILVTGRSDRDSVMEARPLHINAYITKPFDIPKVQDCIEQLLPKSTASRPPTHEAPDFLTHLGRLSPAELDLPLLNGVKEKLKRVSQGVPIDFRELIASWQHDAALCAYLISAANSAAYGGSASPCNSLGEALHRLGGKTSLNLAVAMALRQASVSSNLLIEVMLEDHLKAAERLAEQVVTLARQCDIDPAPLQIAALLHRIGELCVLLQAQQWVARAQDVDDNQLLSALSEHARSFAIALKTHWGLPMALRELIGAVYALPQVQVHREQVLMRLAAAICQDEPDATVDRLKHLAGIS